MIIMKLKYLLLIVALFNLSIGQAQFGRLKSKLKKAKKKVSSTSKREKGGAPKYDPNSKVYRAHSNAKEALKSLENTMSKPGWKNDCNPDYMQRNFKKARKNLDFLKADEKEASKKYYKSHEKRYASFDKRFQKFMKVKGAKMARQKYFEGLDRRVDRIKSGYFITNLLKSGKSLNYEEYKKRKEAYQAANQPDEYSDKYIKRIDNFYNNELPQKYIPALLKNAREKVKAVDDDKWKANPQPRIKSIDEALKVVDVAKSLAIKENGDLQAFEDKYSKRKKSLEEYISSGKYDAYKAVAKKKRMDAKRVNKVGMRNAQAEAVAKKSWTKKYGVPALRVAIGSTRWGVKKNSDGIPKYKYVYVEGVIKKKNGNCHVVVAWVQRNYEGGGRYGTMYATAVRENGQINCANIYK